MTEQVENNDLKKVNRKYIWDDNHIVDCIYSCPYCNQPANITAEDVANGAIIVCPHCSKKFLVEKI